VNLDDYTRKPFWRLTKLWGLKPNNGDNDNIFHCILNFMFTSHLKLHNIFIYLLKLIISP